MRKTEDNIALMRLARAHYVFLAGPGQNMAALFRWNEGKVSYYEIQRCVLAARSQIPLH